MSKSLREYWGHPQGLWILSLAELVDRFCYYGIVTVMTLYLAKVFLFSDEHVYAISGVYSTLGFGLPVLGGLIADRFLGYRKAVVLGMLFLIIGNLILCGSGLLLAYIGLSFVVVGIGLLKANVTSQVGTLYLQSDDRKEGAFAIFYFGMNLGALLGPIVFGSAIILWGWHAGFIFGAAGMIVSLALYLTRLNYFGQFLIQDKLEKKIGGWWQLLSFILILIGLVCVVWMFAHPQYFADFVWVFGVLMLGVLGWIAMRQPGSERRHILAFFLFIIFSIFYFACARQVNTSIELFLDREISKNMWGFNIPTEWFASFEPIFISLSLLIITPFWRYLGQKNKHPSPHSLVILGLFFGGLSFVIFGLSAWAASVSNPGFNLAINLPLWLLLLGYFVLGLGELAIFPSITALVSDLAPPKLQSTFMGFWLLSSSFSAYIGALMAELTDVKKQALTAHDIDGVYAQGFFEIAAIVFVVMLIALLLLPWMRRLIKSSNHAS